MEYRAGLRAGLDRFKGNSSYIFWESNLDFFVVQLYLVFLAVHTCTDVVCSSV
jgi:hypothetical protein